MISAVTTRMARKTRKMGVMTLPIQTVISPGRRDKISTMAKKITEKIKSAMDSDAPALSMGATPTVKEVVAHLGMAKPGPMVR